MGGPGSRPEQNESIDVGGVRRRRCRRRRRRQTLAPSPSPPLPLRNCGKVLSTGAVGTIEALRRPLLWCIKGDGLVRVRFLFLSSSCSRRRRAW